MTQSSLAQLKALTTIVADTGDLAAIEQFRPLDATTNPSLITVAANQPENRVLIKVNVEDAERADAIFTKLMGDDVSLRKNFIQSEAKNAKLEELDI